MRSRPARISDGFYRTEIILPAGSSREAAEALEIYVETSRRLMTAFLKVSRLAVHLPDLDDSVFDRLSPGTQQSAAKMRDLSYGWSNRVTYNDEIIVGIERNHVW